MVLKLKAKRPKTKAGISRFELMIKLSALVFLPFHFIIKGLRPLRIDHYAIMQANLNYLNSLMVKKA